MEKFLDDLQELIEKHSNLPLDDRPTVAEVVGAMECKKYELLLVEYGRPDVDD